MAQGANTFDRYDLGSGGTDNVREQFSDVISNISPTEVPFCANSGVDKSMSDYEEWETDALAAAASNENIDGDQFVAQAITNAVRVGNYHQIGRKQIQVSFRANVIQKAGRDNEMSYQMAKKGKELRRDVEYDAIRRKAARPGTATESPRTAGAPAWLVTNLNTGASGAAPTTSGTGSTGYPNGAGTVGTARALSEATFLEMIRSIYAEGSVPNMILFGTKIKVLVSAYMFSTAARIAPQRQNQAMTNSGGVEVIGAVDVFVSDFGKHDFVPDLFIEESASASEILMLNTEFWKISYLRRYQFIPQPNDGDAERELLLVDWAVKCKNEKASGCITAINADEAMVA